MKGFFVANKIQNKHCPYKSTFDKCEKGRIEEMKKKVRETKEQKKLKV